MKKENQYLRKYSLEERERIVNMVLKDKMSYREIERKYNVPRNTVFRWVKNYKERGTVKPLHGGNIKL